MITDSVRFNDLCVFSPPALLFFFPVCDNFNLRPHSGILSAAVDHKLTPNNDTSKLQREAEVPKSSPAL